jgi:hypothetical protein
MNNFVSEFTTSQGTSLKHMFVGEEPPSLRLLGTSFLVGSAQAWYCELNESCLNPAIQMDQQYLSSILKELARPKGQYSFEDSELRVWSVLQEGRVCLLTARFRPCQESPREIMLGLFQLMFQRAADSASRQSKRREELTQKLLWVEGLGSPAHLPVATERARLLLNRAKQEVSL